MVIDHAHGLHKCIANGRTYKVEAIFFEGFRHILALRCLCRCCTVVRDIIVDGVLLDKVPEPLNGVELRINQPLGGYALWLQLPECIDGLDMYYFAQQHGINIVPGEVFGEGQRYKNCIRLNAGHEISTDIRAAVTLLADWVKAQLSSSTLVKQAV